MAFTEDGSLLVLTEYFAYGSIWVTFRDSTTLTTVGNPIQLGVGGAHADLYRAAYADVYRATPFALTRDGGSVVVASPDGELAWWDLGSRERARALEIPAGYHAFALSPDGRTAAVGIDGGIRLVDVGSEQVRASRGVLAGEPAWLLFSPDGETVVSTGLDGSVTLWDVESATPRATLRGHSASVGQPVYSPDGATLYTASDDGTAIAWDVDGNRRLGRPFTFTHDRAHDSLFDRHPGRFSPDGRLIAVGLKDKGIRLWDATALTTSGRAAKGDERRGQGARVQSGRANARGRHPRRQSDPLGHGVAIASPRAARCRNAGRRRELQCRRDDARHGRRGRA